MRALLIVNPHATSTTERRRDLLAHALAGQVQLVVAHTRGRGHATDLAAAAAADGVGLVVVHAGDGTVNEAVNGLLAHGIGPDNPKLAVVPGGSTNVFARGLGVDPDPTIATEQILEALPLQRSRRIGLGRADCGDGSTPRYFTFNAGLGLDAEVVARVEKVRATGKKISNALHVREMLRLYRQTDRKAGPLTVTVPGHDPLVGAHLAFVSNIDPWTYVGRRAVRTNPDTTPAGGLGVFASTSISPVTVTRLGRQVLSRNGNPRSKYLLRADDVPQVTVSSGRPAGLQLDGDYLGLADTVEFQGVPDALTVVV